MVSNTRPIKARGAEERIRAEDLTDGQALDSNRFVELFSEQGDSVTAYGPGNGPQNRQAATGFSDLDLQVDNDGVVEAAKGKLRWEIYADPAKEDLVAVSSTFDVGDFRSAVSAARTEKRVMPAQQPLAGDDSHVVLAFRSVDSQDGATVSVADSDDDVGIAYSRYK